MALIHLKLISSLHLLLGFVTLQVLCEVELRAVDLARRSHLEATCSSLQPPADVTKPHNNHKLLRHLIVDEKRELVFCYVPKVACSNWKRVFIVATQNDHGRYSHISDIPSKLVHRAKTLDFLSKYVTEDVKHVLKNYKKILFVRHPFDRLFSAYRSKFSTLYQNDIKYKYGTKIIRKYRKNPSKKSLKYGQGVTFAEFAKYVSNLKLGEFDEHWDTVNELCQPCIIDYDFIGKIESMDSDSEFVLSHFLNDSSIPRFPGPPRHHQHASLEEHFSTLSLGLIQKLYDIYETDFKLFGYEI